MNRRNYLSRIKIPLSGSEGYMFFTKSYLRIAKGYQKVIIDKKPMLELLHKHVAFENLKVHKVKKDYIEYVSKDYCRVKVKLSNINNRLYCSAFDLFSHKGLPLVEVFTNNKSLRV